MLKMATKIKMMISPVVHLLFLIVTLSIALTITIAITACSSDDIQSTTQESGEDKATAEIKYSTFGYPVDEPHEIEYLVPNALNIESVEENKGNHYTQYPKISGLKEKMIEASVNALVVHTIEEVKALLDPVTIAPYRGIRTRIKEDARIVNRYVHGYEAFNCNNILSVSFRGSAEYSGSGATWISVARGLNVDLNTGEHVPLSAIFVDGYDYESVINDFILKEIGKSGGMDLMSESYGFQLVKPFTGIDENQPFTLSDQGITILFSETDDLFDNAFHDVGFYINFAFFVDNLAIDKRYYDEDVSLFEDESPRRLFTSWFDEKTRLIESEYGTLEDDYYSLNLYANTPDMDDMFATLKQSLKNQVLSTVLEGEGGHVDASLSKTKIGDFVQFMTYFSVYSNNKGQMDETVYLYDRDGIQMALKDLFVPGFDYDAVIKDQIEKACVENTGYILEKIMEAYETLSFQMDYRGIIIKISYDAPNHYMNQLWQNIPFHVFGIENLVLFDR